MQNSKIKTLLFGTYFILSLAPIGIETSILSSNLEGAKDIFNSFRLIIPIFIFITLIIFIVKNLNTWELKNIFFIFIYFIVIFLTTLLNLENYYEIHEIQKLLLPFYCINYVFLILVALNTKNIGEKFNSFIFLQFIIITTIAIFSLLSFFSSFINLSLPDMYNLKVENSFYNQNSNGLSRILLVISLFIFLINKRNKYLFFSCSVINTALVLLQSKVVLLYLFLFILTKVFFEKNTIREKIKNIFLILAFPVLIAFFTNSINTTNKGSDIRIITETKRDIAKGYSREILDLTVLTSLKVRIETWKIILKNSKKPLVGYGSQADKSITKNLPQHTQLAANSFIYAYACAGLIGIFSLIIIYYNIIRLILKTFILNKFKDKINNLQLFYVAILLFLIFRSFFENSFALWSIDFILMVNCYVGYRKEVGARK